MPADMNAQDFSHSLHKLGMSQADIAARLGVNARTVRRWQTGEQPIPLPVVEVINAWRQLQAVGLPWGADLESVWFGDDEQIRLHQDHDKALAGILERVRSRGGPSAPWRVNLRERRASLGPITVSFNRLRSNSFSPSYYRRSDNLPPDARRDQGLIEDAVSIFAEAVADARRKRPDQGWDE